MDSRFRSLVTAGLILWAACTGGAAHASTLVYPHALFMDDENRSAVLYVQNTGNYPEEVEIGLSFGYPASDSLGGVHIKYIEDPALDAPTAAEWVRALPRRVLINPGQRQAIRLLANPPTDLAPGEYWSRVIVSAHDLRPSRALPSSARIRVGLTLETRTIISLNYRCKAVATGVILKDLQGQVVDDQVIVDITLQRHGNAAYLGKLTTTLTDLENRPLGQWDQVIAAYYEIHRRFRYPAPELTAGKYRLHVTLSTARQDIPAENLLSAKTLQAFTEIVVP